METCGVLQHVLQLSKFYLQLQHFYMCPFSCPQDVETIFELHPYTLQHSIINFFQCNPCTKCGLYKLGTFWIDISLGDGLAAGHRAPLISRPWIFFLWRYVKDRVYATPVPDVATLRTRLHGYENGLKKCGSDPDTYSLCKDTLPTVCLFGGYSVRVLIRTQLSWLAFLATTVTVSMLLSW
jgi:hypothetical protein